MAFRGSIPDFALANPLYIGASVTFFTVDASGNATAIEATLFANPTGSTTALNPQTLDSEGKFVAPVYIETPVIAVVVGATVGTHTTGVINARGTWRGPWAGPGTVYFSTDFVSDPVSGNIYLAAQDYAAGASITADVAAGNLVLEIDQTALISGGAGNAIKLACDCATTASIAHAGFPVIDGFQTVAGSRILDKDNADPTLRGIWNPAAGAWTRSVDMAVSAMFGNGCVVNVISGTVNHGKRFQLSIPSPFTLGTSPVVWTASEFPASEIVFQITAAPDANLTTGIKGYSSPAPFNCTINLSSLIGDAVGSIVIDIYKAAFPTVPSSGSICGSAQPTLSNAQAAQDSALTGWTLTINKGDVLAINVLSVSGLKFATLTLGVTRS